MLWGKWRNLIILVNTHTGEKQLFGLNKRFPQVGSPEPTTGQLFTAAFQCHNNHAESENLHIQGIGEVSVQFSSSCSAQRSIDAAGTIFFQLCFAWCKPCHAHIHLALTLFIPALLYLLITTSQPCTELPSPRGHSPPVLALTPTACLTDSGRRPLWRPGVAMSEHTPSWASLASQSSSLWGTAPTTWPPRLTQESARPGARIFSEESSKAPTA